MVHWCFHERSPFWGSAVKTHSRDRRQYPRCNLFWQTADPCWVKRLPRNLVWMPTLPSSLSLTTSKPSPSPRSNCSSKQRLHHSTTNGPPADLQTCFTRACPRERPLFRLRIEPCNWSNANLTVIVKSLTCFLFSAALFHYWLLVQCFPHWLLPEWYSREWMRGGCRGDLSIIPKLLCYCGADQSGVYSRPLDTCLPHCCGKGRSNVVWKPLH